MLYVYSMKTKPENRHVLIASDEEILQMTLLKAFQRTDYQVYSAKDGLEALYLVKTFSVTEKPFNLLLVDSQLPKLSCLELFQQLRKLEIYTSAIIITSPNQKKLEQKLRSIEKNSIIKRPFLVNDLLNIVEQVFENISGAR